MQLKQDAAEPCAAGPTETVLFVVEHLESLPGFCRKAFKQIKPTYLVLVPDSSSDGWNASEGVNPILEAPLLQAVDKSMFDARVSLVFFHVGGEGFDGFIPQDVSSVAVTALDMQGVFSWVWASGAVGV